MDVLSVEVELHSYTDSLCSAWIIEVVKLGQSERKPHTLLRNVAFIDAHVRL